jgi:hypothetical protein
VIRILFLDELNDLLLRYLRDVPAKICLLPIIRSVSNSIEQSSSNATSFRKERTYTDWNIAVPITSIPAKRRIAKITYVDVEIRHSLDIASEAALGLAF